MHCGYPHLWTALLAVFILLSGQTAQIRAAVLTWDGSGDMSWTQPDSTSWTGGTYASGDTAQFLGSGAGTITLSGTITPGSVLVNSTAAYTFTGSAISGSATLTKSGTGVLTLLNANTYTGLTTINAGGIIDVGTISSLAISNSSGIFLGASGSGGILQGNGLFTRSLSASATPGANQVAGQDGGFAARGGVLTVNFGGAGSEIALNTGGYVFGNNFIFGSATADSKVILQNNVNLNSTGGRTITVNAGIGGDAATSVEFTGVVRNVSLSAQQIRKNGDGMLILSNAASSFDGQVLINAGTLSFATITNVGGGNSSLGAASTAANGTIKIGSSGTAGRLLYTGTGSTTDRIIDLAGTTGGATLDQSGTGLLLLTGGITATGTGTKALTLQGSTAGTGEISGSIVNPSSGVVSLVKGGSGTWTLSGANTFSGDTKINDGTLSLTNNLALQNSAFDTSGAGFLSVGVTTPTFGGLKGATNLATAISSGYGSITSLTLNPGTGANVSYSGVIANGAAGMSLIKTGAGNQTLTGANTYSGGTNVSQGSLTLDGGDNRLLSTGAVVLGSAGTTGKLVLGGTSVSNQTLTSLSTTGLGGSVVGGNAANSLLTLNITSGTSTFAGTLGGAGTNENKLSLTKAGAGTLNLTGTSNTYAGLTNVIDSGVLDVGTISSGALSANSGLLLGSATLTSGNYGILQGNGSFTRALSQNATPGAGQVAGAAGGFAARGGDLTVNFGGAGAQIGLNQSLAIFGNNFIFGSSTADSKVILINSINLNSGGVDGTRIFTVRAGVGGAEATSAELRGVVSDGPFANGIVKAGDGMLVLSAANTYTGPTTITAGLVAVAAGGNTGAGIVTVQNGAGLLGTGVVKGSAVTAQSGSTVYAGDTRATGDFGTLTFTPVAGSGSFNFQSGSQIILGLNTTTPGSSDLLNFIGTGTNTLLLNGNLQVTAPGFVPTSAQTYNLLDWTGLSASPTFANRFKASSYSGLLSGNGTDDNQGFDLPDISGTTFRWDISQFIIDGTIRTVDLAPEPTRALLLGLSLTALVVRRRRVAVS